jgi:tetratricopeptide (TPR) repeat protein
MKIFRNMKIRIAFQLIWFCILALWLMPNNALAQKEQKIYLEADELLSEENYELALIKFKEVTSINPTHASTPYKLLLCEAMLDNTIPVEGFVKLEAAYAIDEYYFYWLGKLYMSRYQFTDAMNAFQKFADKATFNGNTKSDEIKTLLSQTKHLVSFFENPDNYEIHQLESPINSTGNELSPVYFEEENELIFASSLQNDGIYKIYFAKKDAKGWSNPVEVKNLGTFTEKTANVEVVNEDGKLFLFKEENGGDLFYSQPTGNTWAMPVEFDSKISNNQLASHFYINAHEDRIIFASNDKKNGLDIYESFKDSKSGNWSKPVPFSSTINSEFNEDSPFLSADEKYLYFTSDKPGGVGGFDVYVSELNNTSYSWSVPKNLGWPINSPNDEFHFKMNEDQSSGYFVSNRIHSKGAYDIYFFWEVHKAKIEGRILDVSTGRALENGEIRFRPAQYLDEYFGSKVGEQGRYNAEIISDETFKVEILQNGQVIHTEEFEIHDTNGEAITHIKNFKVKG